MRKDSEGRKGGFCLLLPVPENAWSLETAGLHCQEHGKEAGQGSPRPCPPCEAAFPPWVKVAHLAYAERVPRPYK